MAWGQGSAAALASTNVICLAVVSLVWTAIGLPRAAGGPCITIRNRPAAFAHIAAIVAASLLGCVVATGVVLKACDAPRTAEEIVDWMALAAVAGAVVISLWDKSARFTWAGLYVVSLSALATMEITRDLEIKGDYPPGQFFVWAGMAEWSAFLLVTALLGWAWPRILPVAMFLRVPVDCRWWSAPWFWCAQATFASLVAMLAGWVALDLSFCGMGQDLALFGLTGRGAAGPSALMLLGASILMAWQSKGAWRAGWQYGAMLVGVLLTSSVSWARIDPASDNLGFQRCVTLMISTGMMTLMTGIGLPRVFRTSDWGLRGRQAAPIFAGVALLMLAFVLIDIVI
jgi:hypothetical protein